MLKLLHLLTIHIYSSQAVQPLKIQTQIYATNKGKGVSKKQFFRVRNRDLGNYPKFYKF